ncbi:hypothetical protein D3C77_636490 [compost metagenome]
MKETNTALISSDLSATHVSFPGELLRDDEIATITGYLTPSRQIQWLAANGWQHALSGARRPVVGRLYARLKLAGLKPSETNAATDTWTFDLTRVS